MGSLKLEFSQMGFHKAPQIRKPKLSSMKITCGLRNGPRGPLWRSRLLSTEAIQAVQSLKLAKSPAKLEEISITRLNRLLKADLLDALTELQRQNELDLAFMVFEFVRKEVWYEPSLSLFSSMILISGKNKQIKMVEELFSELKKEGLEPDTRAYTELIGAYFKVGMIEKAMGTFELLKASGCVPDRLTFAILIRNLEKVGKEDLAAMVKEDCTEYLDSPKKFLKEIEKTST